MRIGNDKNFEEYYFNKVCEAHGSESTQHYHNSCEIYYMKSGKCDYFAGGRFFEVNSGDIILIPEGVIHKTNYRSPTHTRLLVNFTKKYLAPEISAAMPREPTLYRSRALSEAAEIILSKIEAEYSSSDSLTESALTALTGALVISLIRSEVKREENSGKPRLIDEALCFVNENYMNDITLLSASMHCSVSAEHLSRAFKRETGFGFNEYLTLIRLTKAEYMLKNEPGRAISEVAYSVGFNDSNYFSVKFKKVYGIAPSQIKHV